MRYQWLVVRLEAIDKDELRELVLDAWRMVVPKKLASLSDDELRSKKWPSEPARRSGVHPSPDHDLQGFPEAGRYRHVVKKTTAPAPGFAPSVCERSVPE